MYLGPRPIKFFLLGFVRYGNLFVLIEKVAGALRCSYKNAESFGGAEHEEAT